MERVQRERGCGRQESVVEIRGRQATTHEQNPNQARSEKEA